MAITATNLTTSSSSADASSYATASITPGADKLILAFIGNSVAGGSVPATPTLSGNGLTWTQVATQTWNVDVARLTIFRATGAAPTTGAITISIATPAPTCCEWSIIEVSGADITGTNAANAIVQTVSTNAADALATSGTVTLSAFSNSSNATFGVFGHKAQEATNPGSGFTELGDTNHAAPNRAFEVEYLAGNDTTVDASWTTSAEWGGIAAEIKIAGVNNALIGRSNAYARLLAPISPNFGLVARAVGTSRLSGPLIVPQFLTGRTSGYSRLSAPLLPNRLLTGRTLPFTHTHGVPSAALNLIGRTNSPSRLTAPIIVTFSLVGRTRPVTQLRGVPIAKYVLIGRTRPVTLTRATFTPIRALPFGGYLYIFMENSPSSVQLGS